jgi:hypothetical protein
MLVVHCFDHTDNLPQRAIAIQRDPLAERIAVRPVFRGQSLVDDRHRWCALTIGRGEDAAHGGGESSSW